MQPYWEVHDKGIVQQECQCILPTVKALTAYAKHRTVPVKETHSPESQSYSEGVSDQPKNYTAPKF